MLIREPAAFIWRTGAYEGRDGRVQEKLEQVGLSAETWPFTRVLLLRGAFLGSVLYLAMTHDRDLNLALNFLSLVAACLWSYFRGLLSRRSVPLGVIEGIFLHLIAVGVGNTLALVFGSTFGAALFPAD